MIQHGADDGRTFIGAGMCCPRDGSVPMAAPPGRSAANVFEDIRNMHRMPMLNRSTDLDAPWQELQRPETEMPACMAAAAAVQAVRMGKSAALMSRAATFAACWQVS